MKKFCVAILLLALLATGCEKEIQYVSNTPPPPEVPRVNLPEAMRQKNWTSRTAAKYGQGSCVHASTVMAFRWQNEIELAEKWRRSYSGGETASSILSKYRSNRIPYCALTVYDQSEQNPDRFGNPEFLEWASETRRGAIIWFKPSHCCFFVGFCFRNGREEAVIIDNNSISRFEYYEKMDFLRKWRSYGGFAATPIISPPAAPIPWKSYRPIYDEE